LVAATQIRVGLSAALLLAGVLWWYPGISGCKFAGQQPCTGRGSVDGDTGRTAELSVVSRPRTRDGRSTSRDMPAAPIAASEWTWPAVQLSDAAAVPPPAQPSRCA